MTKDNSVTWFKFPVNYDSYAGNGDESITCSVELNSGNERMCTIQTKATALDCVPTPETTSFLQEASDYSFIFVNNTSASYVIESITIMTNYEPLTYEEVYIWNGDHRQLRMIREEYQCYDISLRMVGDIEYVDNFSFMGILLSKNEYGVYVGHGNFTIQNNGVYTLELGY